MVARENAEGSKVLAVKVGNAETAMGLFDGEGLLGTWSATAGGVATADEVELAVRAFLEMRSLPQPEGAIVCSVAPMLTGAWVSGLQALSGRRPFVVGPGLKSGIAMGYKDPGQIGADRVACAVGARELLGAPVIVADFGTATTLTVVDRQGTLLGGAIAPGLHVSLSSLCDSAAQLAEVSMQMPRSAIGRTTADAIRSGVLLGEGARIDGLVGAVWDELGYETALVATGRHARAACAAIAHEFEIEPDLALWGLASIWKQNER